MRPVILNFISDIATPHVNQLLRAVVARGDVELRLWYSAEGNSKLYSWKLNPTHEIVKARIFGNKWPHPGLISHALLHPREKIVIVGWSNPTTRALVPMLTALGRRYAYFTDQPVDARPRTRAKHVAREAYFRMLRQRAIVFAVGSRTVDYFVKTRGFAPGRVCNLPIPVPTFSDLGAIRSTRAQIRERFAVHAGMLFLVTGSRLTPDKGFDLLLGALGRLDFAARAQVRLLIVGKGPEEKALKDLVASIGIAEHVVFEEWMDFDDFSRTMAAADVVVHPARFDAFGGITLTAVGLGVPVIGSRGAGSALELIEDGKSGFLYDAEDVASLCAHIRAFVERKERAEEMSEAAIRMAHRLSPKNIADILVKRLDQDAPGT